MMQAGKVARRGISLVQAQTNKFSNYMEGAQARGDELEAGSPLTMMDEESKHRNKIALYDLNPYIENCWVAPSATVVGEVTLKRFASVWYNSVVRGDINSVS